MSFRETPIEIPDIRITCADDVDNEINNCEDLNVVKDSSDRLGAATNHVDDEETFSENSDVSNDLPPSRFTVKQLSSPTIRSRNSSGHHSADEGSNCSRRQRSENLVVQIERILNEMSSEDATDQTAATPDLSADSEVPKKPQKPSEPPITFREFDVRTTQ